MTTTAMSLAAWLAEARRQVRHEDRRCIGEHLDALPAVVAEHDLAQREAFSESERDRLWDACLSEGHGPDPQSRTCRGPNRDDDPCPVCTEMAKQHPVFLARGGQEA